MEERSIDRWFVECMLVYEPLLLGYLRSKWPDKNEVSDIRQETFARVYKSALREIPRNPKSFLFTTARNIMVDRARSAKVTPIEAAFDLAAFDAPSNEPMAEDIISAREEFDLLCEALDDLPPRCREIVTMRKIDGFSQKEVAAKLGVTVKTVENQLSKGIRRLANQLYGVNAPFSDKGSVRGVRYLKGNNNDT